MHIAGDIIGVAGAQEAAVPLTLEESIAIALKQSVIIQSAREGVAASEARKKEAFTGFLPKLSTTYNYTHNDPAQYIKQPPPSPITNLTIGTQDNYIWSLDARQPLFTGGRLEANYEISRLGLDASKHEEMGTVQDIVLEVKRSYFTILKAKRLVGVAKQSVEQFIAQQDLAKNFYEVGPRSPQRLPASRGEARRRHPVSCPDRKPPGREPCAVQHDPSTAGQHPCRCRRYPRLQTLREGLRRVPADRHEQPAGDPGLCPEGRTGRQEGQGRGKRVLPVGQSCRKLPALRGQADLNGSAYRNPENWTVAAVATWDLWEWGRTKYSRDASVSQEKQAVNALTNVKDQVALDVKNAWLAVKEAEKLIAVTRTSIEQAEENYRINQERYREQVSRMTDVLDALTLLTFARASWSNALSDYHIALAALERAMGVIWKPQEAASQQ